MKPVSLICYLLLNLALPVVPRVSAVEISEILPDNSGGLRDEDGDTPGWIELRNPSNAPVDLGGWHLTDTEALPARWTFPAVSIPANGWLVVFASGKNRAQAGSPLHTNFQLAGQGEYLALTNPAGVVISGFLPSYPKLRRNVSFAVTSQPVTIPLVASGAVMRYQVPTNAALDSQWYNISFNDASWTTGMFPAGFDANGGNGLPVLSVDFNDRDNNVPDTLQPGFSSFLIGNTGGNAAAQTGNITRTISGFQVSLTNTGADPYDDRYRTLPTDAGALTTHRLLRDFVFSRDQTGTTGLDVTVAGLPAHQACQVYVWSYDNSSPGNRVSDWFADGVLKVDNYTFSGSALPTTDTAARLGFEAVSDAQGKLVIGGRRDAASATFGVFLNALQIIPQGFSGLVQTNLSSAMRPLSGSVYVRVPFAVSYPAAMPQLRLKVRYDDGFTARINGQLVASRNAPASPAWNSLATASRTTAEALTYEEITIPNPPGLLVAGENILAVQGLNAGPDDPDFLTDVQLDGIGASAVTPLFYTTTTPGTVNAQGFAGLVADTKFSIDRGFFTVPFSTTITTSSPGAEIRYTLDGSVPTPSTGLLYAGPVPVNKTTILRAAAFFPGYIPSNTDTQSYIFPDQTGSQPPAPAGWPATWGTDAEVPGGTVVSDYEMDPEVVNNTQPGYSVVQALNALPSLSLTLPPEDFLGSNGIYQFPKNTGDAWERACSIEFMDPANAADQFAENCQVEVHGNSSRRPFRVQKHSFRLTFKSELGSPRLSFPLFPGSPVREFNQLILRACFTDAWCLVSWDPGRYRPDDATYIRDVWMKRTQEAMGYLAPDSRFCHLYINGLYWGMYNVSERIDGEFVASHRGGLAEDWEVIPDFVDQDPSATSAWKSMFNTANAGLATAESYQIIQQWLDPVAFADYYLLHQFGEAEDWPHHNGFAYRHRTLPGSRFQWITWDQEIALNNHGIDRVSANAPNTANDRTPGRLLNKLRDNAEFRLLFADRAHRHLHNGGALDVVPSQNRWSGIAAWIDQAIVAESARWGDTADATPYGNAGESRPGIPLKTVYTRAADWLPTINSTRDNWIPSLHNRTNFFSTIRRLQAAGLYPLTDPPVLNPHGGVSTEAFNVTLSSAVGEIYFTTDGSDPREAVSGAARGTLYQFPVNLAATTNVKARVLENGVWSALAEADYVLGQQASASTLRISELYYHPPDGSAEPEFIELLNTSSATLDLGGAQFSEGIFWVFPAGTLLAPGARMVVTGNQFAGKLDNAGEFITLLAADGSVIFRFSYSDRAPWPAGADGEGASLVMMTPGADPADPANWRPSVSAGGSLGSADATAYSGSAVADSDGDGASDFLEYAMGTNAADAMDVPQPRISQEGGLFLLAFTRAAAADDVRLFVESSSALSNWNAGLVLKSRTPDGSGRLLDVWGWNGPLPERQFFRVRAVK